MHDVADAGAWPPGAEIDTITLDFDQRHRRRWLLTTAGGREILLDLPRARRLRDGDGLTLPAGVVRVVAAPEKVMDIHAGAPDLLRIAWHLGNRHLAVQLRAGAIRIRADHVLADMGAGLGGHVHRLDEPFEPEGGAYDGGSHGHHHHHDDDVDHQHGHAHDGT